MEGREKFQRAKEDKFAFWIQLQSSVDNSRWRGLFLFLGRREICGNEIEIGWYALIELKIYSRKKNFFSDDKEEDKWKSALKYGKSFNLNSWILNSFLFVSLRLKW